MTIRWLSQRQRKQIERQFGGGLFFRRECPQLLTEKELSADWEVSDRTIRNYVRRGMPKSIVDGRAMFDPSECMGWKMGFALRRARGYKPHHFTMREARQELMHDERKMFPGDQSAILPRSVAEVVLRVPIPAEDWPDEIVIDPAAVYAVCDLGTAPSKSRKEETQ